jgi:DAK2 domain fusion protein YloV
VTDGELLARLRDVAAGAAATLEASRQRINDLNVYPVPDGDTGTNLSLSVAAVVDALAAADPAPPAGLAALVRRAALMGARGNSGIILSQIVRGACDALGAEAELDGRALARTLRGASDAAYRAVRQPVEGTILTVVRAMAEAAEAADTDDADAVLDAALEAGATALAATTDMLDALRDAGVVDAGGAGLLEIVRGAAAGLRGHTIAAVPPPTERPLTLADAHGEPSRYRYCTNYLVHEMAVDPTALEEQLGLLGDSLIVVGDAEATKVHLHTDDPGRALSIATAVGTISGVDIADMHAQIDDRNERLARPPLRLVADERRATDVVFVVAGEGNERIARSLGARRVVPGGQSMNPSTEEILRAIESAEADGVVVLPNNRNVVATAQAAADASSVPAHVVATTSIAAGLAVLVAYGPDDALDLIAPRMEAVLTQVRSAEITRAVRTARVDGVDVAEGAWLALVDGRVVASAAELEDAVRAATSELLAADVAVITALTGAGEVEAASARSAVERIAGEHPDVEFDIREGGQPLYALVLGAE